jgi:hypothetical protein
MKPIDWVKINNIRRGKDYDLLCMEMGFVVPVDWVEYRLTRALVPTVADQQFIYSIRST